MKRSKLKRSAPQPELDSVYILKIVCLFLLGAIWLRIFSPDSTLGYPLPLGFVTGLALLRRERFQTDRKIGYAVLIVAMLVSLVLPVGIVLNL